MRSSRNVNRASPVSTASQERRVLIATNVAHGVNVASAVNALRVTMQRPSMANCH